MNYPKLPIILFTPPSNQRILDGTKTMTARFWKRRPPKVDSLFRAQTGRRKETTFAICRVTDVFEWDGASSGPACDHFNCVPREIGEREGFRGWGEFYEAYLDLNHHHWNREGRTHYFVEFEVVEVVE